MVNVPMGYGQMRDLGWALDAIGMESYEYLFGYDLIIFILLNLATIPFPQMDLHNQPTFSSVH
jgi:hypothetical protein